MKSYSFGANLDKIIGYASAMEIAYDQLKKKKQPKFIDSERPDDRPFIDIRLTKLKEYDNSIRLDASLKDQFEHLFNFDFSSVRVHTGHYAEELTRRRRAEAITIGRDIYFARGKYSPDSEEGIRLLAHELQHVIQSSRGDRLVYREDIEQAEHEAGKAETLTGANLLFGSPGTDVLPIMQSAPTPVPFPNIANQDKHKETPLEKSAASDQAADLDDFSQGSKLEVYEIMLKDGSRIELTQGELNAVFKEFNERVDKWFMEKRSSMTESDYNRTMIKFFEGRR